MRYKGVAKRKIIELEETLDYSDGQAVGFESARGSGRPWPAGHKRGCATWRRIFVDVIAQHAFHGEPTTPTNNDSNS